MGLCSKDHYDLMEMFEREFASLRLDREDKAYWPKGNIYQNGETNSLFLAYRMGAAYGRSSAAPADQKDTDHA